MARAENVNTPSSYSEWVDMIQSSLGDISPGHLIYQLNNSDSFAKTR